MNFYSLLIYLLLFSNVFVSADQNDCKANQFWKDPSCENCKDGEYSLEKSAACTACPLEVTGLNALSASSKLHCQTFDVDMTELEKFIDDLGSMFLIIAIVVGVVLFCCCAGLIYCMCCRREHQKTESHRQESYRNENRDYDRNGGDDE